MLVAKDQNSILHSVLEQLVNHLGQECVERRANCNRLATENAQLRNKNTQHLERILSLMPIGATFYELQRKLEVQQACSGVLAATGEQVLITKEDAGKQYKQHRANLNEETFLESEYDGYTMMPYHDAETEIKAFDSEILRIQKEIAQITTEKAAKRSEIDARIKEIEAEKNLFNQLLEEVSSISQQLALKLQQTKLSHKLF